MVYTQIFQRFKGYVFPDPDVARSTLVISEIDGCAREKTQDSDSKMTATRTWPDCERMCACEHARVSSRFLIESEMRD